MVDGGFVENSGSRDGVSDDLVGERELKFQFPNQFVHAPSDLFLVGAGEVHRGGVDDGEDAAFKRGGDAVAVRGTAIDADNQL